MAKRKFIEQRRKNRVVERTTSIDARAKRDEVGALLTSIGVEFETHWSEDAHDDFDGFCLSYDPPWDRMWYIVRNPFGGLDLELAIDSDFDISFGFSCWSFHSTEAGYAKFCETITAVLTGNGASVSCLVDGEDKAHAILVGDYMNDDDMRLLERIAERDYYRTNMDIEYNEDFNLSIPLKKKLRKLRSRKGWTASFVFWNPAMNKKIEFNKSWT